MFNVENEYAMKNGELVKWFCLVVLVVACETSSQQQFSQVDSHKFQEVLEGREVQLIDVRTPEEVSYGKIEGAGHIDFYDPEFETKISKLDKEKPVALYCAAGGRSAMAGEKLMELGFKEVYDLSGGFRGWQKDGYPIVKE